MLEQHMLNSIYFIDVQMEIGEQQDAHEFLLFLVEFLMNILPKR